MPKQLKRGVLSNDEKAYVEDHFRTKSVEEMASELNRSPDLIGKFVLERGGAVPHASVLTALRTRPEWDTFRLEFNDDELRTFEHHYIKLMGQFGGEAGMLPTEEMQVFDLIRSILQSTRIQRELRKFSEEMLAIQNQQAELKSRMAPGRSDKAKTANAALLKEHETLERRYAQISKDLKDVTARLNTLDARRSQLLKELKGTRDQRVKLIEDAQKSYTGLLRMLFEEDFRKRQEELMRMAAAAAVKEKERLAAPHKYVDGIVDQPLLTSDTLLSDYDQA